MLGNADLQKALQYTYQSYELPDQKEIAEKVLFKKDEEDSFRLVDCFKMEEGVFPYPSSEKDAEIHWTANFADSKLFGFCGGSLLAQDELQVLEHPALYHMRSENPIDLASNQVVLVDALRMGSLDTSMPLDIGSACLPKGYTLYGNNFTKASSEQIQSKLTRFGTPHQSHIFAMAALKVCLFTGKPYNKEILEQLFYPAYNAFAAIKAKSQNLKKTPVIHTGNWGCGAFGNHPTCVAMIQCAAAQLAEVEMRYYPVDAASKLAVEEGFKQFKEISNDKRNAKMTVDQFLDQLLDKQFKCNEGNGT